MAEIPHPNAKQPDFDTPEEFSIMREAKQFAAALAGATP